MLTQAQLQKLWIGPTLDWPMPRSRVMAVDQLQLNKVILEHSASLKTMGGYESVSKPQAVKGDALAALSPMLYGLLDVAPSGEINNTQLKAAVMAAVCSKPELNNTNQKNDIWCGLRVDRIVIVLNHLRRLLDETKFQQMASGTQGSNVIVISELLKKLEVPSEEVPSEQVPSLTLPMPSGSIQESEQATSTVDGEEQIVVDEEVQIDKTPLAKAQKTKVPKVTMSGSELHDLFGGHQPSSAKKVIKPTKKPDTSSKSITGKTVHGAIYRKAYYKANHSYGFKRVVDAKAKQIFSLPGKSWSKDKLMVLADKVLHDLHKCKCELDEQSVEVLAKYKLGL